MQKIYWCREYLKIYISLYKILNNIHPGCIRLTSISKWKLLLPPPLSKFLIVERCSQSVIWSINACWVVWAIDWYLLHGRNPEIIRQKYWKFSKKYCNFDGKIFSFILKNWGSGLDIHIFRRIEKHIELEYDVFWPNFFLKTKVRGSNL